VSHEGVFQFCSLPFGLATGPSAFQQVIRRILEGLPGCANILDDVIVYGRNRTEHDGHLRGVLNRLAKYGATLRVDKCVLGQSEVDFNGHRVSAEGVRPLQSNVAALERISAPTNQRQLSRFVGAATYYAKFVPQFAELCKPFRPLLKQDSEWVWSMECQRAFDTIKKKLPVHRHWLISTLQLMKL
jgi:Reverse transcriptase (RNA-dependent DNA polymerase)